MLTTSHSNQDGNQTKLEPGMSVRFYRLKIRRSLREGHLSSLSYLLLCLCARWNDYTHVSLVVTTHSSSIEYSLSWYGVETDVPRDDYDLEIPLGKTLKEYHSFYGYRCGAGHMYNSLDRVQTLMVERDYFCSIQQIVSTWLTTIFKSVKPQATCVNLVVRTLNLPRQDVYTPQQLRTLLIAMGCKEFHR